MKRNCAKTFPSSARAIPCASTSACRKAKVGIERIFPLHSPTISSIEVVGKGKVRRARLYYLRDLRGKAARIKRAGREEVAAVATAGTEAKA